MDAQMSQQIKLIVGLGNPGKDYAHTRHNAGAWCLQAMADKYQIRLQADKKHHGLLGKGQIGTQTCWLLAPTTYMNLSGVAVSSLANFHKLRAQEILVLHDEIDLPVGCVRLKQGGGHGGQNGLRDIINRLGKQADFYRLRIGIAHPGSKDKVTAHVLGKPREDEKINIEHAIERTLKVLEDIVSGKQAQAMNLLHSQNPKK